MWNTRPIFQKSDKSVKTNNNNNVMVYFVFISIVA